MARLGFVDQEGNVSHITSSYTPKKKKKEEVKINDNKSTDIRTVKTGKNLIDDAKIIKKGVDTGIISGLTGVADAPFQAAQEEIQKGKNIKSEKELLKDAALGILRASSPLANSILGNRETSNEIKKTLKDKNKSTLEKIVNSGLAVIGNEALDNTYQGAKAALRIGGAINPNLDKTVSNIQSFIDKPAETKQQELSQEIQDYSSPVQFLTTAGQTIGNMLPSIGATAITKDPSAGLSLMGVSAKGQATKEALQNGADITQANRIGTAKGLLEVGTELATGGLNIFGKGALDDITTNFINKKIGSKGLNFLAKQIAGVGGEIGEELVSDVVGTLIDRGTIDPNADYSSKEAKETILQTIATTLLLNGLTGGYTPRAYRQNAIEMQESRQNNGNVLNNNDTVIPDTNQVREVNEIQQKVENGEITYEEANQQMEQVQNGTYQQNQNNQVVIQEAQKQFDAINQAEANGIMDSETANQERQAIINTMNQMQQDTNTQENESYEPQEVQEEKRQSPIDKLSDEEKEQLNKIYQKQANREKITDQDRKTLEYFTRKTNDLKNHELNKNITKFDDVKSGYKYVKNFDESKFDSTMVDKAKDIVSANKQGRRTKQQWLDVAKNIGMQADNLDSKALEKLAFESWAYTRPNQRGVLNRQGAQKVDFQIHEWVKAVYEGARVGEKIESRVESPKIQVNQEKTQTKEVETKETQEPSLKNAKQYYNRNLGKYTPGDAFESAIGEYQLRPEEAENLRDYTIKKYPDYAEEINRRYNDLYNQEEQEVKQDNNAKKQLPHSSKVNEIGYHASNNKFDKYDTSKIGTGQGDNTQGKGINLASVKEAVEGIYGDNVYETKIDLKNAYTVDDKKLLSTFEKDFGYKTNMENISDELKKKGYDGIVINVNGNKLYTVFDSNNAKITNGQTLKAEEQPVKETTKEENINKDLKTKQLEIINKSNPMQDEYHTGIRNENDIKTFEEAINDDESFVWGDYSKEDAQRDLEKGTVTVYSSKPIEQGIFVSTSRNQARDYAGGNEIYSQEVPIEDVAWINGDEGQYAKISNGTSQEIIEEKPVEKIETKEQKQEYFKDNGVNEEGAKFLSEMPKPDKLSVRERIKQGKARRAEQWAWFKRNVVDKGEAIYKLAKELKNPLLYAKYDKRGTTTGEANYDIGEGQTNLKGKKYKNFKYVDKNGKVVRTGPMSLNQIWEGIDPTLGNEYIGHWLNVDRYKQTSSEGKKIIAQLEADVKSGKMTKQEMEEELKNYNTNRYVISPNFTDEMSKKKIAELEEAHPELKVFGENVWQYGKNQLQNMLDAGMISEQQAKQWQKETPHYVRLQRNIPNNTQSTIVFDDKGNARVSNQIKEFKGSTLDVLPFKDSMAAYTLDVRNSIRENAFAQELAKSLGVSSNNQEITDINDIMGFNPELLDNGNGTYSLTFLNKGVPTTMPITQGIYEALQPNKHYEWENKPFFEGVRKVDSIRKALLTDKNPMFLATNMMKDLFDAPLNSKYPVLFAKNYPKAIWQVVKNGELYQQYKALGGLQNTYFEKSDGFKKPSKLDVIGRMNNAIEQFPRVAEFMSTMEKTGDVDQAMYNAAEITTNFKRGGDVAKAINRNGFTFLNASIQGFSKQIRNFTDISNPKEATKMLLKALILGVAPALINDAGWGDDEDYQELQDYQKDRYYIIGKTKDGTFIRIPKGRAVSVFQSAARRTKYALGGDKKAFNGFVKFAQDQVAPNNPLDNNLVSPLVNVYRNTSWSGNDIIPQSMMEYTKTEDQFNEKTDVVSRKIGKALGKLPELPEGFENFKSPMGINYLIDQYSGALGDVTLPYITPKASSKTTNPILKPIRDKFTGDFAYSNKNVNTFYEVQKELKKKSDTPVEDAKSSYMISQGKELSKLYTKQREIQNNNKLSKSEKYEKAREVQKEINEFAKKSVKDINNVDENKYYLKIGDKYFKRIIKDGEEQYVVDTSKKIPTEKYALYDYFKSKYEKSKEGKK